MDGPRTQSAPANALPISDLPEVETLDRDWQLRRVTLMVRNKAGDTIVPRAGRGLVISAFTIVVGMLWMVVTGTAAAPAALTLIGLLVVILGALGIVLISHKAAPYRDAERSYLRQREALLHAAPLKSQTRPAENTPAHEN